MSRYLIALAAFVCVASALNYSPDDFPKKETPQHKEPIKPCRQQQVHNNCNFAPPHVPQMTVHYHYHYENSCGCQQVQEACQPQYKPTPAPRKEEAATTTQVPATTPELTTTPEPTTTQEPTTRKQARFSPVAPIELH